MTYNTYFLYEEEFDDETTFHAETDHLNQLRAKSEELWNVNKWGKTLGVLVFYFQTYRILADNSWNLILGVYL